MKLLKKYKSRIGFWLIFSFILQVTSPLVAAMQLQTDAMPSQENLIIDSTVNSIITRMVEAATQAGVQAELSAGAKKCYKKIAEGQTALPALAVWDAMPNMLNFAVESVRAARPAGAPSAVVGQGNCEVTQLLALIKSIQSSIGSLCNNECNNTILGILGNARDILGVNISCALEELVFTDSLVLERLEELESSLTACCNGLQIEIEELDIQIAECCEAVIADIFESSTIILDKISTLSAAASCCDCDFFITQVANGEPNNHPVGTPITIPGIYCLAESVTGTVEIQTSNVTVLFRGHTLTPDQGTGYGVRVNGDVSAPYNNIRIEGGTIQGGTDAQFPLDIQNCMGVTIVDMSFVENAGGNIQFFNVNNFIIQRCQFLQGGQTAMVLINCASGHIAQCTVRDFAFDGATNYIVLSNASQIIVEDILITNNAAAAMTVFFLSTSNNSTFRNIRITNNTAATEFRGIDCLHMFNNTIEQYVCNNNQIVTASGEVGTFYGINLGSVFAGGNDNTLRDCQINGNSIAPGVGGFGLRSHDVAKKITRALTGFNVFVGIDIGTESQPNSCQNTVVENCSINGNSCTGEDPGTGFNVPSLLIGVNVGSVLGTRLVAVADNVGANTVMRNCTVDRNSASTYLFGVNVASILFGSSSPSIGVNTCQNSVIENCTVNNNVINGELNGPLFFVGFSIGSVVGGPTNVSDTGTIGDNCGTNCSLQQCTVNNNSVTSAASLSLVIAGLYLASAVGSLSAVIGQGVCGNCSISDCTVNSNTYVISNAFTGIGIANILSSPSATIGAKAGSGCALDNCSVEFNAINTFVSSRFFGISLAGIIAGTTVANTVQDTVCASCSIRNSTVNNNTTRNGFFAGINLAGTYFPGSATTITLAPGVCDSCVVSNCAINNNQSADSQSSTVANSFFGINVGANNRIQAAGPSSGVVTNGSCNNCVITETSINRNQFSLGQLSASGRFFGVGFGFAPSEVTRSGNSCNNCVVENLRICRNTLTSDNGLSSMQGVSFGANNAPSASLCKNITATRCFVEDNTFTNDPEDPGTFVGFYARCQLGIAVCDNLTLTLCEVNGNTVLLGFGYNFVSVASPGACLNNLQLYSCIANQNPGGPGFSLYGVNNATVDGCVSNQNSDGFALAQLSHLVVNNCSAMNNDPTLGAGFALSTVVDGVVTGNRAFRNVDGFRFGASSTGCLVRGNVAQNNETGFRGIAPFEDDNLLHNFAQSNITNYVGVNPGLIVDVADIQAATPNPFANVST